MSHDQKKSPTLQQDEEALDPNALRPASEAAAKATRSLCERFALVQEQCATTADDRLFLVLHCEGDGSLNIAISEGDAGTFEMSITLEFQTTIAFAAMACAQYNARTPLFRASPIPHSDPSMMYVEIAVSARMQREAALLYLLPLARELKHQLPAFTKAQTDMRKNIEVAQQQQQAAIKAEMDKLEEAKNKAAEEAAQRPVVVLDEESDVH